MFARGCFHLMEILMTYSSLLIKLQALLITILNLFKGNAVQLSIKLYTRNKILKKNSKRQFFPMFLINTFLRLQRHHKYYRSVSLYAEFSIMYVIVQYIYNQMNYHMFPTVPQVKLEAIDDQYKDSKPCGPFFILNTENKEVCFKKAGEWSLVENAKYAAFIDFHSLQMEGKPHGRLWGKYQEMAKFLGTRNFRQCKSHHQKNCIEFNSIPHIISSLITQNSCFQELFQKEKQNYQAIKFEQNSVKPVEVKNPQPTKDQKEENVPTAASYRDDDENQNKPHTYLPFPSATNLPRGAYDSSKFPSMSLFSPMHNFMPPEYDQMSKHFQHPTSHQLPIDTASLQRFAPSPLMSQSREQKWKQCHMLFIEWVKRMNQLQQMINNDF